MTHVLENTEYLLKGNMATHWAQQLLALLHLALLHGTEGVGSGGFDSLWDILEATSAIVVDSGHFPVHDLSSISKKK